VEFQRNFAAENNPVHGNHCARQNCCAPKMLLVRFCEKPESVLVAAEIQPEFRLVEYYKT
jgi:hypothetical protein